MTARASSVYTGNCVQIWRIPFQPGCLHTCCRSRVCPQAIVVSPLAWVRPASGWHNDQYGHSEIACTLCPCCPDSIAEKAMVCIENLVQQLWKLKTVEGMTVKRDGFDCFLEGTWPGSYLWWSLLCILLKIRASGLDFTVKHFENIFSTINFSMLLHISSFG